MTMGFVNAPVRPILRASKAIGVQGSTRALQRAARRREVDATFEGEETTMELPTLQYVDLSTAHISMEDSELLADPEARDAARLAVYETEYGFFIPLTGEEDRLQMTQQGFSDVFADLVEMCQEQGIQLIRLDQDALEIAGLPTFAW
jgi:hypothetical protein